MGGFVSRVINTFTGGGASSPVQQVQQQAVQKAPTGPTEAELTDLRLLKTKRRGRRSTILGVNSEEELALGKPTLLG